MKYSILTVFLFIGTVVSSFSQNCSKFYPFSEGAESVLTMYDNKNNIAGTLTYNVSNVSNSGGVATATMSSTLTDHKGNTYEGTVYQLSCQGNTVSVDFKSLLRSQMLQQFQDMEYTLSGVNMELPNDLSVGQSLPDASLVVTINAEGMTLNMTTDVVDRKVVDKETVTTPAGSFHCYVLAQTVKVKTLGTHSISSKQWIAEGVGLVKSEDYNKRGKLQGVSLLTSFSD